LLIVIVAPVLLYQYNPCCTAVSAISSQGIVILIGVTHHPPLALRVVQLRLKFVHNVISSIAQVHAVHLHSNLFVAIESSFIFVHSTATTHALTLVILVSVACQSSIEPTHNSVLVLAVIHATGNHVQFVNVHDDGVHNTPQFINTFTPSTAICHAETRDIVVSEAFQSSILSAQND
jgi:hypothetical protein